MSYQYPPNYIEHYSPSPTASSTPHALNPVQQWDTSNPQALQDSSDQVQQQQQQQVLHSPIALNTQSAPSMYQHQHMSSEHTTPIQAPVYEPPTVIQLQERPPRRSALQRKADRDASATTSATKTRSSHHTKQISPLSLYAPSPLSYERHDEALSPTINEKGNESELARMPIRHQRTTSRAQVRFSTSHPYNVPERPVAGSSSGVSNLVTASSLLGHYQQKSSSPYATLAYPSATDKDKPSPALSAASSSPLLTVSAIPPLESNYIPPQRFREGRYVVRVDMYYSKTTKMLTAFLELPGIKKSAINVKLVRRSGVKHLEVFGKSQLYTGEDIRRLSGNDSDGSDGDTNTRDREGERERDTDEGYYLIRERKHGDFRRILIVPEDTTPERVSLTFEDGLLLVKIPCEQQTINDVEQEVSEIPVK